MTQQKAPAGENGGSPTNTTCGQSIRATNVNGRLRARQAPWPLDYDAPSPRGRIDTVLHFRAAGLCPGYSVAELRECWADADTTDEREAIVEIGKAVSR